MRVGDGGVVRHEGRRPEWSALLIEARSVQDGLYTALSRYHGGQRGGDGMARANALAARLLSLAAILHAEVAHTYREPG